MRKLGFCAACHRLLCRKPRGARVYVAAARGREANACAAKRRLDFAFARTKRLRRRQNWWSAATEIGSSASHTFHNAQEKTPKAVARRALDLQFNLIAANLTALASPAAWPRMRADERHAACRF
jgi:hypothetical protein